MKKLLHKINVILGLSFSLAKARFKLRNEGSLLGVFWYLLEPLVTFSMLLLVGGALSQRKILYYPIYVLLGLIMYHFFTAVTSFAIKAIVSNAEFIRSMKISKEAFVVSGVIQFLFSHLIEVTLVVALAVYLKISLIGFLAYPLIFILFGMFTLGLSFILATSGVYVRDLSNVWTIVVRLLMFGTPIFYRVGREHLLHTVNRFNPLTYFITLARDVVIYNKFPDPTIATGIIGGSFLTLFLGIWIFKCNEARFSERVK